MKLKIKVPSGRKVVSTEYGGFYGEYGDMIEVPDALGQALLDAEPDAFELAEDGVDTLLLPTEDAPSLESLEDAARKDAFSATPTYRKMKDVGNGD